MADPYDSLLESEDSGTGSAARMSDGELCTIIEREQSQAIGFNDQLQSDREKAMEFYFGEPKGELAPPEVEGRSKVVSKDLMDVVEWTMPSLMEEFASADDIIRFEPSGPAEEKDCDDATRYCGYVLNRKNNGFTLLHDAIKSALITRMGVIKVYCDRSWQYREEVLEGQSDLDLQAIQADDNIEIVEVTAEIPVAGVDPVPVSPGQMAQAATTYTVRVKIKERKDQFVVAGVPPEEITISKDSREIDKVRYIGHDVQRTKSDLISMGYPRDKVERLWDNKRANYSSEAWTRSEYDGTDTYNDDPADRSQEQVTVTEAYLLVDYDRDGIAEYRRVVKSGRIVFENDVVETHPFALFTPVLMPYKLIGMSMYDLVEDLMRIKTALTRQMLDNQYLANNPRTEIVTGQVNMDDFLNPVPGGGVRVNQPGMMREIITTNIGPQALSAIQYVTDMRDARTGVKEFSHGLVGDEISKSQIGSEGVSQLMDAAATRIKLMARVFAETGLRRLYQLILKLVTQYQDREQQVKVNGHWMQVDPRAWRNNYDMVVSIGVGTSSKQQRMATAMQMLQIQQQAYQVGLVTPQNAYSALEDLTQAMGKTDVSRYFSLPDPNAQQKPDPEMAKVQAQMQLQQAKQQGDVEVERMKQQFQAAQAAQETQLEAQRNQAQMQNEMALAQFKAEKEAELERYKADLNFRAQVEIARIKAEAQIAAAKVSGAKDASTADADIKYQEDRE